MERLHVPWLFIGPTSSGKLYKARKWIEDAHGQTLALPLESRTFSVGDGYEARVLTSPFHFEIDIPNLSMQDKQIIGELLTTFFSSCDVLNSLRTGTRKLVILRRAHSLSLPAAIRVRAVIQQFVLPAHATGMLWMTAREMTGPLALLSDAFVQYRVPRVSFATWTADAAIPEPLKTHTAWDRCNGRVERVADIVRLFPSGVLPSWPRRVQDFYDETIESILYEARSGKSPTLGIVLWIRARIYQALSMCQTGPEIVDSMAAAVQKHADLLEPTVFWKAMSSLSYAEPHTSYRTPLSLESAMLNLFETVRTQSTTLLKREKPTVLTNGSVESTPAVGSPVVSTVAAGSGDAKPAAPARKRAAPRKKKTDGGALG